MRSIIFFKESLLVLQKVPKVRVIRLYSTTDSCKCTFWTRMKCPLVSPSYMSGTLPTSPTLPLILVKSLTDVSWTQFYPTSPRLRWRDDRLQGPGYPSDSRLLPPRVLVRRLLGHVVLDGRRRRPINNWPKARSMNWLIYCFSSTNWSLFLLYNVPLSPFSQ